METRSRALQRARDSALAADEEEACPICLQPLSDGHGSSLVCGHVFHSACIIQALRLNRSCPVCRQLPDTAKEDEEEEEEDESNSDDEEDLEQNVYDVIRDNIFKRMDRTTILRCIMQLKPRYVVTSNLSLNDLADILTSSLMTESNIRDGRFRWLLQR